MALRQRSVESISRFRRVETGDMPNMLGLSGQAGPLPWGSILGTRVLRTEDPALLRRGGIYTDDVMDERLDGAVHVTFVRSPVAHARIESVDAAAALTGAGVVAVF